MNNDVNHPPHYNAHPSGIECITVVEHMGFNLGNAIKYVWRADLKGNAIEDLEKARWYVDREIARRKNADGAAVGVEQQQECPTCHDMIPIEHDHDWTKCNQCMDINIAGREDHKHYLEYCNECKALGELHYVIGVEAGKATLKPFDEDMLMEFLRKFTAAETAIAAANAIANHFAAPKQRITVTLEQADRILQQYEINKRLSGTTFAQDMKNAIELILHGEGE